MFDTGQRAERITLGAVALNLLLGIGKLLAGVLSGSYALVADAAESLVDLAGSALVYSGLRYARKPADHNHPYGHWRAESLAALGTSVLIFGVGLWILYGGFERIVDPSPAPAAWAVVVLVAVIVLKESLFRVMRLEGRRIGSDALVAEAWHQRTDAITSIAAVVGVSLAVWAGPRFAIADPIAALIAAAVVLFNAVRIGSGPVRDLMDTVHPEVAELARAIALEDGAVTGVEQSHARRLGRRYWVDMHIEVDPGMSVEEAHRCTGRIKQAVRERVPAVADVLIHVEPGSAS